MDVDKIMKNLKIMNKECEKNSRCRECKYNEMCDKYFPGDLPKDAIEVIEGLSEFENLNL